MHSSITSPEAKRISRKGVYYRAGSFAMKRLVCEDVFRYSIVVSKRQGNAVKRHRVKRVMRELFRHKAIKCPKGLYLVYFRGPCDKLNRQRIARDLDAVIEKIAKDS